MEPGQNVIAPEATTTGTPEVAKVAEFVLSTPVPQPQTQNNDDQVKPLSIGFDTEATTVVPADEVKDLTDSVVEKVDQNWVGKVREVIRDDKDQPQKEEEDAEKLQENYMKQRFNVDVDAPIEEK
jgi:hypothetical protein